MGLLGCVSGVVKGVYEGVYEGVLPKLFDSTVCQGVCGVSRCVSGDVSRCVWGVSGCVWCVTVCVRGCHLAKSLDFHHGYAHLVPHIDQHLQGKKVGGGGEEGGEGG